MLTSVVLSIFSDCVLFYHAFQVKSTQIYFDTYYPCISNCWARPRGLQKVFTLIGGQRAEKFENHWLKPLNLVTKWPFYTFLALSEAFQTHCIAFHEHDHHK